MAETCLDDPETLLRSAPISFASLLLLASFATVPLAAELVELPAEWPLGVDSKLSLELDGADLHVATRTGGLPVLQARAAADGESAGLDLVSSGGVLTVRRPIGGEGEAPRLRIDVTLAPGYTVSVTGAGLTVRAEDKLPADSGGLAVRLAVERSTARLKGVRLSRLEAIDSSLTLTGTEGGLALTVTGGSTQVLEHRGRLELTAIDAGVAVAGHQGGIVSDLEGGSFEIEGGEGTFSAKAAGAELSFDDWRGPAEVRARDSEIDVRGAEHRDRWQLAGEELQVILDRVWGTVEANLDGGSLEASQLSAAVGLTAAGTRLDLVEVAGSVALELTDGAEAVVAGVAGNVEAEVDDSRLVVERVDRLKLTGRGADVTALAIERLESLALTDSQLALDLRDSRSQASLELRGVGYASVRLKEPCIVQLSAEAALDHQVEVVGCELRAFGEEVSRRQDRLKYGEAVPARLNVSVDSDAVLEVEGEPWG